MGKIKKKEKIFFHLHRKRINTNYIVGANTKQNHEFYERSEYYIYDS